MLTNIDAATFSNTSNNAQLAFRIAVAGSVVGIEEDEVAVQSAADLFTGSRRHLRGQSVNMVRNDEQIENYEDTDTENGDEQSQYQLQSVAQQGQRISVQYNVSFVLEALGYSSAHRAAASVQQQLAAAVRNGSFDGRLALAALSLPGGAQSVLFNVTSSSVVLISTTVDVLRSARPTLQPTMLPTITPTDSGVSSSSSSFSSSALNTGGTIAVSVVVIIFGICAVGMLVFYAPRIQGCSVIIGKFAVCWYECVRPRGHANNPYRGTKKAPSQQTLQASEQGGADGDGNATNAAANTDTDAEAELVPITKCDVIVKPVLIISRHSAAMDAVV